LLCYKDRPPHHHHAQAKCNSDEQHQGGQKRDVSWWRDAAKMLASTMKVSTDKPTGRSCRHTVHTSYPRAGDLSTPPTRPHPQTQYWQRPA
jgi:hypothetical protein